MSKNDATLKDGWVQKIKGQILQHLVDIIPNAWRKKLTVQAEVQGVEKVEQAKQKIESLPKTKTVEMEVKKHGDFSALEMTGKNLDKTISVKSEVSGLDQVRQLNQDINTLPKTITVAPPPVSQWTKMKGVFAGVRAGINDISGGMKNLASNFMSKGGGVLILYEGIKSLINIGKHFYGEWIDGMKESAAMSEQNASSIREAAQANEELRQKSDEYLKQLEQLASQENLSNANKEQAAKAIGELTKAYGDLGIKLDETTGKLTGVDSAMIKKAEKDKNRRIKELEAELRELENSNQQQAELRDKAGIPVWFGGNVRLGGKETSEAAARKIEENTQRIMVIRRNLHDLRQSDPAGEIRARKKAEEEQLEAKNRERQKAFEQRQKDDEFAAAKTPEEKITNRRAVIKKFTQETLDPLKQQVAAAQDRLKNAKVEDDKREARRNLLQLQGQQLAAKEKIYNWRKQTSEVEQHPEKSDKKTIPDQQKAQKALNLQISNRDKAQDLKWQMMEKTGRGKEASEQRALYDAEKAKGGKLTDSEIDATRKLHDLTWNMQNMRDQQFGDLSIKTNSLTARGGFQGAAVVPDSDKYNREISMTNKTMLNVLQRIETICSQLNKF